MKKMFFLVIAFATLNQVNAQTKKAPVKPVGKSTTASLSILKNASDSFSYAAGMSVAKSMKATGAEKINTQLFAKAMNDVYNGSKLIFTVEQANMTLQEKLQQFSKKKADAQKLEGQTFLNLNKKRTGVTALPNGLQYEIIKSGTAGGLKPKPVDTVVVNYVGTLVNGTEFDNSFKRGQAASFPLNGVIRGWTEILQYMTIGDTWKVYIPSELGYGENPPQGAPIPPNAVLIFEIALENIKAAQPAEVK